MKHFVVNTLERAAKIFEDRNLKYGDAYKNHGAVMKALFPSGLKLESISDFTRFAVFNAIVGKLNRQARNFEDGGHSDSLYDLSVFAIMQMDVDRDSD